MQFLLVGVLYLAFLFSSSIDDAAPGKEINPQGARPLVTQKTTVEPGHVQVFRYTYKDQSTCIQVKEGTPVCLPGKKIRRGAPVMAKTWTLEGNKGIGFLYADQIECSYAEKLTCQYRSE